ncbi:MAG: V-type ATP synthase subunit A, partial [Treponema sp.]|nr:V-type ATP synthase subunit A [Treponema sp.]
MKGTRGKVASINGNMVAVEFDGAVMMNEVAFVETEGKKLKGEVIRIKGNICSLQVFEMTKGISVGETVEFSGDMLAIELGPGLLTQVYDGLQNPLP